MADIFDTVSAQPSGDVFDRVASGGDVFDRVASPDLSKVGTSAYDKFKLQELHAPNLPDYPITVPRSMDPNMDFARATGGNPTGKLISGAVDLAGQGLVKIADIPTRIHNIGKTPESPDYVPTLEERTADGKNIINLPRATGTGPVSGALNVLSSTAEGVIGRPQSAFMLPLAAGEGAVAKLTGTAFGAQMAAGVPDALNNALQVVSDPNATDAQKTEAIGNPLVQAYFAKKLLGHGMAEPAPPQMQGPLATGEVLQRPKGATPPPLDELSDVSTVPSAGPTFSGIKETDIPKIPKSEVPETAPEAERGINVSEEIRNHVARTIADIQRLFPQAQLTRESAKTLRNAAWGKPDANGNLPEQLNKEAGQGETAQLPPRSPEAPTAVSNEVKPQEPPRQPTLPQTNVTPPVTQVAELPIEEPQSQPVPKTIPAGDGTAQETVPAAQAVSAPESAPTVTPEPKTEPLSSSPTAMKYKLIDEERQQRGLEPLVKGETVSDQKVIDTAMAKMDAEPELADNLVKELNSKPRSIDAWERGVLLLKKIDLRNQFNSAAEAAIKASDSKSPELPSINARISFLSDELTKVEKASRVSGSEQGRGLRSLQIMANEDFSLAGLETRRRAAKGGEPLTVQERGVLSDLADAYSKADTALQQRMQTQAEPVIIHPKVIELANRIIANLDKRADSARARITARTGSLFAGLDPTVLRDVAEIGASHLAHIGKDFVKWSAKMVEEFGENVKPHLQEIYDRSQKMLDSLKTGSAVKRTIANPEERALKAFKTRTANTITKLEGKIESGDFTKTPRKTVALDREAMQLKATKDRLAQQFEEGNRKAQLAARSKTEKAFDWVSNARRFAVLSGTKVLAKLAAYSATKVPTMAIEGTIGKALENAPGISKIAERAPSEGSASAAQFGKAVAKGLSLGFKDAYQTAFKGGSDLKTAFSDHPGGREWYNFFGTVHEIIKSPLRRTAFELSLSKRLEHAAENGIDVTDPMVQLAAAKDAYLDSDRALLLEKNRVASGIRNFLRGLERPNPKTGKVPLAGKIAATAGRVELPILTVPFNYLKQTLTYAFGLLSGGSKAISVLRRGVDTLTPEEADQIMRHLKQGSVGAGLLLYGFYDGYKNGSNGTFGGYYQPGEKRKEDQAGVGGIRVGEHNISGLLLHNPALAAAQLGHTIGAIAASKRRKKDTENQGLGAGAIAGAMGLLNDSPIGRQFENVSELMDPRSRQYAEGEMAKSHLIPQAMQEAAEFTDRDAKGNVIKRKPKTIGEHIETGIPGFRKSVPTK